MWEKLPKYVQRALTAFAVVATILFALVFLVGGSTAAPEVPNTPTADPCPGGPVHDVTPNSFDPTPAPEPRLRVYKCFEEETDVGLQHFEIYIWNSQGVENEWVEWQVTPADNLIFEAVEDELEIQYTNGILRTRGQGLFTITSSGAGSYAIAPVEETQHGTEIIEWFVSFIGSVFIPAIHKPCEVYPITPEPFHVIDIKIISSNGFDNGLFEFDRKHEWPLENGGSNIVRWELHKDGVKVLDVPAGEDMRFYWEGVATFSVLGFQPSNEPCQQQSVAGTAWNKTFTPAEFKIGTPIEDDPSFYGNFQYPRTWDHLGVQEWLLYENGVHVQTIQRQQSFNWRPPNWDGNTFDYKIEGYTSNGILIAIGVVNNVTWAPPGPPPPTPTPIGCPPDC